MKKEAIIQYVRELDWRYPADVQQNAVRALTQTDDQYLHMILDKHQKATWENAVQVIGKIGYPRNAPLLSDLIWLLQDVNWPGADKALEILSSLDKKFLMPLIEEALCTAEADHDTMWIGGINLLVKKARIQMKDFHDDKMSDILKKADF